MIAEQRAIDSVASGQVKEMRFYCSQYELNSRQQELLRIALLQSEPIEIAPRYDLEIGSPYILIRKPASSITLAEAEKIAAENKKL